MVFPTPSIPMDSLLLNFFVITPRLMRFMFLMSEKPKPGSQHCEGVSTGRESASEGRHFCRRVSASR